MTKRVDHEKKLQNIRLAIIPMLFLITFIYSIVTFFAKRDIQNWYSFLGQIVLAAVWIFANLGSKKVLKNKISAIVSANVIFQALLFAHIVIYIFYVSQMQTNDTEFAEYLVYGFIVIGFAAIIIMICDLVASVTDIDLFRNAIELDAEQVNKLNKIFLAAIPSLIAVILMHSIIIVSINMMYVTLNFLGSILLIAIWVGMNLALGKYLKNKRSALIISQIVFQAVILVFIVCYIVLSVMDSGIETIGYVYCFTVLCMISIAALLVSILQLKVKNSAINIQS